MPLLPGPGRLPRRPTSSSRRGVTSPPRIVVVGDLVLDVVLAPDRELNRGTDVTGRVVMRQGGSASNSARWLGRLGMRPTLVCAVGRDATGRALVADVAGEGVDVKAIRVAGAPTGRIGVLVEVGGERSFVTERGAALKMRPEDLRGDWFAGAAAVHLPAYSLLDQPLGLAGMAAAKLGHAAGALVTVDLSSSAPLLAHGRRAALRLIADAAPDLLFATRDEARALVGPKREERLLELAPIAIVKRGRKGVTVLARERGDTLRFEIATTPVKAEDTTGAGDAFDAGFLTGWLRARADGLAESAALQRGALLGNKTALRQITSRPPELSIG
jgi:ribokinase